MQLQQAKDHSHIFRSRTACGSQIKINNNLNPCKLDEGLSKQLENQLDSVTEKPICFLRLQGLACDWSKHNKHSRNIFSVHGFLRLSVTVTLNVRF